MNWNTMARASGQWDGLQRQHGSLANSPPLRCLADSGLLDCHLGDPVADGRDA